MRSSGRSATVAPCSNSSKGSCRQDAPDGPNGPLWGDIAVSFAYFLPLLFRRLFPFLAPVVAAVAVAASTFLDGQRVPYDPMVFLLGMTIAFLFGSLPEPRQAIAGFAILVGVNAIVVRNEPTGSWSDMIWSSVIFGISWTIGFGLGYKFREAEEAKDRAAPLEREDPCRTRPDEARVARPRAGCRLRVRVRPRRARRGVDMPRVAALAVVVVGRHTSNPVTWWANARAERILKLITC